MYLKHNKKVQEIGTWDRYTFAVLELTKLMELIQVEYIEWVYGVKTIVYVWWVRKASWK